MAKIIMAQKSGSVGTSTFHQTRQGLVERQRVVPLNPRTPAQERQRMLVAAVNDGWRDLTDAQRAGWRALAGQLPGQLSGCAAYQKVNVTRLACGQPTLADAPAPPSFGILVVTGLVAEDSPRLTLTGLTATVAPDAFIVEATRPLSAGIGYVERRFRRVTVLPGHAGPAVDLDLTAAYVARFHAPAAGKRIFVRLYALKDGFKSAPVRVSAMVAGQG